MEFTEATSPTHVTCGSDDTQTWSVSKCPSNECLHGAGKGIVDGHVLLSHKRESYITLSPCKAWGNNLEEEGGKVEPVEGCYQIVASRIREPLHL